MRIVAGVGDLVQRTRDGQAQVGYLVVGRLRGWVMLCAVYTMHEEREFLGLASKLRSTIFKWFGLKTIGAGFPVWGSKSPRWFLDLILKIKRAMVCQLHEKSTGG
jgi:hypothetical protein